MAEPTDFLSRKQAAEFLSRIGCPISVRTLANLAANDNAGKGPAFLRIRKRIVRYERRSLEQWAFEQTKRII